MVYTQGIKTYISTIQGMMGTQTFGLQIQVQPGTKLVVYNFLKKTKQISLDILSRFYPVQVFRHC